MAAWTAMALQRPPPAVRAAGRMAPARVLARGVAVSALVLAVAGPAQALYKVVGPDGRITYTDRPPASGTQGKVTSLTAAGTTAADPNALLPSELRQAASRYPVTLYVIGNCPPCDSARALLRQRGVPFAEKVVATEEDVEALQRIAGTRDAPTVTIGAQPVRGLTADAWNAYLDAAGYPRESRLPAGYVWPQPTPLVERRDATPTAAARGPAARADEGATSGAPAAPAPVPVRGGIRF